MLEKRLHVGSWIGRILLLIPILFLVSLLANDVHIEIESNSKLVERGIVIEITAHSVESFRLADWTGSLFYCKLHLRQISENKTNIILSNTNSIQQFKCQNYKFSKYKYKLLELDALQNKKSSKDFYFLS